MARGGLFGVSPNQLILGLAGLCISLGTFSINSIYAQVKKDGESVAQNVSALQIEQRASELRVTRVEDSLNHVKQNLESLAEEQKEQSRKLDKIINLQLEDAQRARRSPDK